MVEGYHANTIDVLDPKEEIALRCVQELWEESKPKKPNILKVKDRLESRFDERLSHEKVRNIIYNLFQKGEILIDVKGRDRLCRPNHVVVHSKTKPKDFRNITIYDKEKDIPISRIWISIHEENNEQYLNLTESKRTSKGWATVNNIIIPPEAVDAFLKMTEYINGSFRGETEA